MPRTLPPPPVPAEGAPLAEVAAALDLARAIAVLTEDRPKLHAAAMKALADHEARHAAAYAAWLASERAQGGPGTLEPIGTLPHHLKAWPVPPHVACPVRRCMAAPGRYCIGSLPHGARLILAAGGTPSPEGPPRPTGDALMAAQGLRGTYLERWPSLLCLPMPEGGISPA